MIRVNIGDVHVNATALARWVRSPGGPVVRDLMRRGTNVQTAARAGAPKGATRALERSIVKRLVIEPRGPVVYVGTSLDYAVWVHNGSAPHVIRPVRRKALRFPAPGSRPGAVGVVFARKVDHPGSKGVPFLVNALPAGRN
jgi:hypothetical protein